MRLQRRSHDGTSLAAPVGRATESPPTSGETSGLLFFYGSFKSVYEALAHVNATIHANKYFFTLALKLCQTLNVILANACSLRLQIRVENVNAELHLSDLGVEDARRYEGE